MKKPTQKEVYTTIIILAIACFAISRLFHVPKFIFGAIGLLILVLVSFKTAQWITMLWLKFAEIMGAINSKVLMSLVFFIFLVPISFLYRLFNKDGLHLEKTNEKNQSNYIARNHKFEKQDLEKTW